MRIIANGDRLCEVEGVSIAPQGNFCQERQKLPKTPFETNGFKTSFARLYLSYIGSAYIAN